MSTENAFIQSQGGVVCTHELVLKAGTLAAGVYTASHTIPAGAAVQDILVNAVALWNAGTSATMIVGDGTDDDGFYTAVDLKATDLLAGESVSFALAGGKAGAYIANSQVSPRYSASARAITAKVTTVGTAPTTGETRVNIIWVQPGPNSRTDHSYTAS